MDESQYQEMSGVRWSALREIRQSPKQYLHALDHPKDSEAFRFGRAFHTATFEPEVFDDRHPVRPNFCTRANWGLDAALKHGFVSTFQDGEIWDAEHKGQEGVTQEEHDLIVEMRDAVLAHKIAGPLVQHGTSEQVITWVDPETGLECKAKVDHLNGRLVELKSTRHKEKRLILNDIAHYCYHGQVAWYEWALETVGIAFLAPPSFIFVTKSEPIDVLVVPMGEAALNAGRAIYRECLDKLKACMDSGEWPGIDADEEPEEFVPPAWADPTHEQEPAEGELVSAEEAGL